MIGSVLIPDSVDGTVGRKCPLSSVTLKRRKLVQIKSVGEMPSCAPAGLIGIYEEHSFLPEKFLVRVF